LDIKSALLCAVQKFSVTFCDDIGNSKTIYGTGFWLKSKQGKDYYVTNRHNVDPTMHPAMTKSLVLKSISIWLRAYDHKASLPCGDVKQITIPVSELSVYWPSDQSDVVMLQPQKMFIPTNPTHSLLSLHEGLTTYSKKPEILDQLYFVGFPGKHRSEASYDLPIARSCSIASFPEIDYSDEDNSIPSSQTCLVDGLSFSGSSGSAVMRVNEKQIELMGIMSGHFSEEGRSGEHSGLSYLTKATSIQRLIQDNNL
jgi:hypothetical protein